MSTSIHSLARSTHVLTLLAKSGPLIVGVCHAKPIDGHTRQTGSATLQALLYLRLGGRRTGWMGVGVEGGASARMTSQKGGLSGI